MGGLNPDILVCRAKFQILSQTKKRKIPVLVIFAVIKDHEKGNSEKTEFIWINNSYRRLRVHHDRQV